MNTERFPLRLSLLTATTAAVAAITLAACGQREQATAAQKVDEAVATTEQRVQQAKAELQQEAEQARAATQAAADQMVAQAGNAADKLGSAVEDAAITARINGELAKDDKLSALRIDVDTRNGHVVLSGDAPDVAARSRATVLASGVKGVQSVENRLQVRG